MAGKKTQHKMRVRMNGGMAEVRVLLQHPMETGNRTDPLTGLKVPRHFIRELVCTHNDNTVLRTQWSWGMARNPYLSFRIRSAHPGDRVRIEWRDDRGEADAIECVVT